MLLRDPHLHWRAWLDWTCANATPAASALVVSTEALILVRPTLHWAATHNPEKGAAVETALAVTMRAAIRALQGDAGEREVPALTASLSALGEYGPFEDPDPRDPVERWTEAAFVAELHARAAIECMMHGRTTNCAAALEHMILFVHREMFLRLGDMTTAEKVAHPWRRSEIDRIVAMFDAAQGPVEVGAWVGRWQAPRPWLPEEL